MNKIILTAMLLLFFLSSCVHSVDPIIHKNIDKLYKSSSFNGTVLASLGDDINYSNAVGWADKENGLNTIFQIGSVTKQFTAGAIMMLQDDGLLQLDKIVPKNKVVYNINY